MLVTISGFLALSETFSKGIDKFKDNVEKMYISVKSDWSTLFDSVHKDVNDDKLYKEYLIKLFTSLDINDDTGEVQLKKMKGISFIYNSVFDDYLKNSKDVFIPDNLTNIAYSYASARTRQEDTLISLEDCIKRRNLEQDLYGDSAIQQLTDKDNLKKVCNVNTFDLESFDIVGSTLADLMDYDLTGEYQKIVEENKSKIDSVNKNDVNKLLNEKKDAFNKIIDNLNDECELTYGIDTKSFSSKFKINSDIESAEQFIEYCNNISSYKSKLKEYIENLDNLNDAKKTEILKKINADKFSPFKDVSSNSAYSGNIGDYYLGNIDSFNAAVNTINDFKDASMDEVYTIEHKNRDKIAKEEFDKVVSEVINKDVSLDLTSKGAKTYRNYLTQVQLNMITYFSIPDKEVNDIVKNELKLTGINYDDANQIIVIMKNKSFPDKKEFQPQYAKTTIPSYHTSYDVALNDNESVISGNETISYLRDACETAVNIDMPNEIAKNEELIKDGNGQSSGSENYDSRVTNGQNNSIVKLEKRNEDLKHYIEVLNNFIPTLYPVEYSNSIAKIPERYCKSVFSSPIGVTYKGSYDSNILPVWTYCSTLKDAVKGTAKDAYADTVNKYIDEINKEDSSSTENLIEKPNSDSNLPKDDGDNDYATKEVTLSKRKENSDYDSRKKGDEYHDDKGWLMSWEDFYTKVGAFDAAQKNAEKWCSLLKSSDGVNIEREEDIADHYKYYITYYISKFAYNSVKNNHINMSQGRLENLLAAMFYNESCFQNNACAIGYSLFTDNMHGDNRYPEEFKNNPPTATYIYDGHRPSTDTGSNAWGIGQMTCESFRIENAKEIAKNFGDDYTFGDTRLICLRDQIEQSGSEFVNCLTTPEAKKDLRWGILAYHDGQGGADYVYNLYNGDYDKYASDMTSENHIPISNYSQRIEGINEVNKIINGVGSSGSTFNGVGGGLGYGYNSYGVSDEILNEATDKFFYEWIQSKNFMVGAYRQLLGIDEKDDGDLESVNDILPPSTPIVVYHVTQEEFNNMNIDEKRQAIVKFASQFIGQYYLWGGKTPPNFDCSGLVGYTYKYFGYDIGMSVGCGGTGDEASKGTEIQFNKDDYSNLKPGDLIVFNTVSHNSHIGIYVGNGNFIQAPSTGKQVNIVSLKSYNSYYENRVSTVRRIIY